MTRSALSSGAHVDPSAALLEAMAAHGLQPRAVQFDGKLHRFDDPHGRKGNKAAWYRAFEDRRGAVFGSWRSGIEEAWQLHRNGKPGPLDPEEQREIKELRQARIAEQTAEHARVAAACLERWKAAREATIEHPYLRRKHITDPAGLKQDGDLLLVPMKSTADGNPLVNLQTIDPLGEKLFQRGGRVKGTRTTIGASAFNENGGTLYICEGWATGWSIHAVTNAAVVVAFTASNLEPVTVAMRTKYPDARLVVACDNDRFTLRKRDGAEEPYNTGVVHGRRAAEASASLLAVPDFQDLSSKPTDYHDLLQLEGEAEVKRWLDPEIAGEARTVDGVVAVESKSEAKAQQTPVPTSPRAGEHRDDPRAEAAQAILSKGEMPAAGVTLEDFYAYMPEHKYIFVPTRDLWPAPSIDARIPPVRGNGEDLKASKWLDQHRSVEQMTWYPGEPTIIEDRLVSHGGWIERPGVKCFNQYRPPTIELGDAAKAGPWLEHLRRVFPESADHMILWFAHRVQRPHEKVNHALAVIGGQGTGKDSAVQGVVPAVGHWNVWEVGPEALMGRFNPHVKSVILRVSEARDLGEVDRYRLYEHLKVLTAAPPDVLRIDEKNIREYMIPNVTGVVITSNHTDGIYLPADDRRHYVAATELTKEDFAQAYFNELYGWYEAGGYGHVAAYLHAVDLVDFNAKAPPPKTAAFWRVVDAGRAPEDAELADALDRLMNPQAVTLGELARVAEPSFGDWVRDRKNSRQIPHRMEEVGYLPIRNDGAKDGRWKVGGRRQVIYARRELSVRDRIAAARALAEAAR